MLDGMRVRAYSKRMIDGNQNGVHANEDAGDRNECYSVGGANAILPVLVPFPFVPFVMWILLIDFVRPRFPVGRRFAFSVVVTMIRSSRVVRFQTVTFVTSMTLHLLAVSGGSLEVTFDHFAQHVSGFASATCIHRSRDTFLVFVDSTKKRK